jgi:hypothetical protein
MLVINVKMDVVERVSLERARIYNDHKSESIRNEQIFVGTITQIFYMHLDKLLVTCNLSKCM